MSTVAPAVCPWLMARHTLRRMAAAWSAGQSCMIFLHAKSWLLLTGEAGQLVGCVLEQCHRAAQAIKPSSTTSPPPLAHLRM